MEVFEPFAGYYLFNILLMVLQALHVFWAVLILRMVYKFLKGKVRELTVVLELRIAFLIFFFFIHRDKNLWKISIFLLFRYSELTFCIYFLQLEKDERSDEESEADLEEEDKAKEEKTDQGGDCYWEKSKETLNRKLSALTNSCVLNNLTHHRSSVANRARKAQ